LCIDGNTNSEVEGSETGGVNGAEIDGKDILQRKLMERSVYLEGRTHSKRWQYACV
jgi:hypothetical protein